MAEEEMRVNFRKLRQVCWEGRWVAKEDLRQNDKMDQQEQILKYVTG